jgi:hypothetical protein
MAKSFLVAERGGVASQVGAFKSEALAPLARATFRPGQEKLLLGVRRGALVVRFARRLVRRLGLTASLGAVIESAFVVLLAMELGGGVM